MEQSTISEIEFGDVKTEDLSTIFRKNIGSKIIESFNIDLTKLSNNTIYDIINACVSEWNVEMNKYLHSKINYITYYPCKFLVFNNTHIM